MRVAQPIFVSTQGTPSLTPGCTISSGSIIFFDQPRFLLPTGCRGFTPGCVLSWRQNLTTILNTMANTVPAQDDEKQQDGVILKRKNSCDSTAMMDFLFAHESQEKSDQEVHEPALGENAPMDDNTPDVAAATPDGVASTPDGVAATSDVVAATPTPDMATATQTPHLEQPVDAFDSPVESTPDQVGTSSQKEAVSSQTTETESQSTAAESDQESGTSPEQQHGASSQSTVAESQSDHGEHGSSSPSTGVSQSAEDVQITPELNEASEAVESPVVLAPVSVEHDEFALQVIRASHTRRRLRRTNPTLYRHDCFCLSHIRVFKGIDDGVRIACAGVQWQLGEKTLTVLVVACLGFLKDEVSRSAKIKDVRLTQVLVRDSGYQTRTMEWNQFRRVSAIKLFRSGTPLSTVQLRYRDDIQNAITAFMNKVEQHKEVCACACACACVCVCVCTRIVCV